MAGVPRSTWQSLSEPWQGDTQEHVWFQRKGNLGVGALGQGRCSSEGLRATSPVTDPALPSNIYIPTKPSRTRGSGGQSPRDFTDTALQIWGSLKPLGDIPEQP